MKNSVIINLGGIAIFLLLGYSVTSRRATAAPAAMAADPSPAALQGGTPCENVGCACAVSGQVDAEPDGGDGAGECKGSLTVYTSSVFAGQSEEGCCPGAFPACVEEGCRILGRVSYQLSTPNYDCECVLQVKGPDGQIAEVFVNGDNVTSVYIDAIVDCDDLAVYEISVIPPGGAPVLLATYKAICGNCGTG